jgi:hypothetical protein
VLLGAGAAMGPYEILISHGANIVALDIDRKNVWDRIIKLARNSPGRIFFPTKVQRVRTHIYTHIHTHTHMSARMDTTHNSLIWFD